jgi:hypothetical protein
MCSVPGSGARCEKKSAKVARCNERRNKDGASGRRKQDMACSTTAYNNILPDAVSFRAAHEWCEVR